MRVRFDSGLCTYEVDSDDRLIYIGPGWSGFAAKNGAPGLIADHILGRSLHRFVTDYETRHLYGLLLERVRAEERPVSFPFRCDGPAVRRFMRLTLSHRSDGRVRFDSRILREEPRSSVRLLEPGVSTNGELLTICSWCKSVEVDGDWVEVELALEQLGLFEKAVMPRISHGCCDPCSRVFDET